MAKTILQVFFDRVGELGEGRVALRAKRGGSWREWTWRDYGEQVSRVAEGLRALGAGENAPVVILSANCPEWLFADIGAMAIGASGVGAYPNELPKNVRYLVEHCRARVLVVDSPEQLAKTDGWRDELESLTAVVIVRPADGQELSGKVVTWEDMLARGSASYAANPGAVEEEARAIPEERLAMLVYTSGTTGPPKGAMYSHANLVYEARVLEEVLTGELELSTISYLPLCHIAERLQGELVAILAGATVSFAESLDKLKENLVEVRPTVLLAVPRVWEKFYAAIRAKFDAATGVTKFLFDRTLSVGGRMAELRNRGQKIPFLLAIQWSLLRKLVVGKLKAALGLDRAVVFVSGAAPLAKTIAEFFGCLEMDIQEVYGQTECVGVCTVNPMGAVRFGTVGLPQSGCEVKLGEGGEILVRGPNVFLGYLDDPEATAAAVDNEGWLHTGDVGRFTEEGYLRITDRMKEIIVTAGGKNVAPQNLESTLKTYPGISQVVVVGDKRKYLVALIALDPGALETLCQEVGIEVAAPDKLVDDPKIREKIQEYVDDLNRDEPSYAQLKYFALLPRELSVEAGEMTPSLKVKRRVVENAYADLIDSMYQ